MVQFLSFKTPLTSIFNPFKALPYNVHAFSINFDNQFPFFFPFKPIINFPLSLSVRVTSILSKPFKLGVFLSEAPKTKSFYELFLLALDLSRPPTLQFLINDCFVSPALFFFFTNKT
jgi:hypothetical protein